jgi:hypothetical protein
MRDKWFPVTTRWYTVPQRKTPHFFVHNEILQLHDHASNLGTKNCSLFVIISVCVQIKHLIAGSKCDLPGTVDRVLVE